MPIRPTCTTRPAARIASGRRRKTKMPMPAARTPPASTRRSRRCFRVCAHRRRKARRCSPISARSRRPSSTPDRRARRISLQGSMRATSPLRTPKERGEKSAAKPAGDSNADEKAAGEKPAKAPQAKGAVAKTDGGKTRPVVHWTPTSSSSLAASPPPGLETKPGEKPKKKPQKADAAAKPAPARPYRHCEER